MSNRTKAYEVNNNIITCPLCSAKLELNNNSLACKNNHSFDISKSGHVNLLLKSPTQKFYNKGNFINRNLILETGFYDSILKKIEGFIKEKSIKSLCDIGCGEGYYLRKLASSLMAYDINLTGTDISKDSIIFASKKDKDFKVKWIVSDLSKLPIEDEALDLILNIFSPASYQEFKRVLSNKGYIIKVVPTESHLKEIRAIAKDYLRNKVYSNDNVLEFFENSFSNTQRQKLHFKLKLNEESKKAILHMTPLLFNVDIDSIDWTPLEEVTMEAEILIGENK